MPKPAGFSLAHEAQAASMIFSAFGFIPASAAVPRRTMGAGLPSIGRGQTNGAA
jgi:hypothetical protein